MSADLRMLEEYEYIKPSRLKKELSEKKRMKAKTNSDKSRNTKQPYRRDKASVKKILDLQRKEAVEYFESIQEESDHEEDW